jgi:predicted Zn-dependent protease
MSKYSYLALPVLLLLLLVGNSAIAQEMGTEEQAAVALYQAGKTEEALAAFQILLRTQPENTNAAGAVAQLYLDKGDYAAAYSSATAALKRAPNTVFLSISAATAAIKLNKPDDALRLMDGILANDPNQDYAHYVRGMALDAKG